MNLINLELKKTEKNTNSKETNLSILKGTRTNYFINLNRKVITGNKKFWSAMKRQTRVKL